MKNMVQFKKKWLLLFMAFALFLVMVFENPIISFAAVSCKNPTITSEGKTMKCKYCNKKTEYVTINLHKGHSLKEVKVDGKKLDIKQAKLYTNGKCKSCGSTLVSCKLRLDKGEHKIEVKDNKGYWIITYVKIKQKGCQHGINHLGDKWYTGWIAE